MIMKIGDLVKTPDKHYGIVVFVGSGISVFLGNGLQALYASNELTPIYLPNSKTASNFQEILA